MLFRKTGATTQGAPVEFRHWKEVVDEFDRELEAAVLNESEEAVVDLWLEDPHSFMEGEVSPSQAHTGSMVRRIQAGGTGLQRYGHQGAMAKTAASTDWDDEFAEAKAHVASVLSNLGNGR